jgi:glutathione S-transferase
MEAQAILAYLGDKTGRLWPVSAAGRAQALQWLFFLSQHVMPAAGEVALRIRSRVTGVPADETVICATKRSPRAICGDARRG